MERMMRGEEVFVDGKTYAICGDCRRVIRTNKPLLGSLHLCDEPPALTQQEMNRRVEGFT
jgi:hypothetical protein